MTSREAANSGADYFDRDGNPITLERYIALRRDDRRIGRTRVSEDVRMWVITEWLGFDVNDDLEPDAPPLIFETTVVRTDTPGGATVLNDLLKERYSTEAEALAGHSLVVECARRLSRMSGMDLCGRVGAEYGDDTWQPVCDLDAGHAGPCDWDPDRCAICGESVRHWPKPGCCSGSSHRERFREHFAGHWLLEDAIEVQASRIATKRRFWRFWQQKL